MILVVQSTQKAQLLCQYLLRITREYEDEEKQLAIPIQCVSIRCHTYLWWICESKPFSMYTFTLTKGTDLAGSASA